MKTLIRKVEKPKNTANMESYSVSDYIISKYDSGMFMLIFNMIEKWGYYNDLSNTSFQFDEDNEEIKIEEFLDTDKRYVRTSLQNKDQIIFYFIPYELIT